MHFINQSAPFILATSYHVSVRTGDMIGAGTDANVYVILYGDQGDTGKLNLKQAINTKNKFERGRTDQFKLEAVDIGKVSLFKWLRVCVREGWYDTFKL